jgi:N-acetylmuramoyl-L-alanine amidase
MMSQKRSWAYVSLLMTSVVLLVSVQTAGADSRKQYFKAEACYRELKGKPQLMKYRDRWLQCIDEFESVHRLEPDGPWAAAGLYMAGQLYLGLA